MTFYFLNVGGLLVFKRRLDISVSSTLVTQEGNQTMIFLANGSFHDSFAYFLCADTFSVEQRKILPLGFDFILRAEHVCGNVWPLVTAEIGLEKGVIFFS